jgi:hypothetical protein
MPWARQNASSSSSSGPSHRDRLTSKVRPLGNSTIWTPCVTVISASSRQASTVTPAD